MLGTLLLGLVFTIIGFGIAIGLVVFIYSFFEKLKIPWFLKLWLSMFILAAIGATLQGLWEISSSLSKFSLNIISQIPSFITANQLWIGVSAICIVLLFALVKWRKSIVDQKNRKIFESSRVVQNIIDTLNSKWKKWEQ